MSIVQKVSETILRYGMLSGGERVLVGVSGGQDSMALLSVLRELKENFSLDLSVAHINHCLRAAESGRDEQFVRETAKRLKLDFFSASIEIKVYQKSHSLSTQAAGRKARTDFFYKLALEKKYDRIALGHTRSDQSETVLINLIRGSGLKGLGGIHPVHEKKIIRPLIEISRGEITDYLKARKISFVEDSSNSSTKYTRNRIRHNLVPLLQRHYNNRIVNSLSSLSETAREDEEFLRGVAEEKFLETAVYQQEDSLSLQIALLESLPISLKRRVLRLAIQRVKGDLKRIGFDHVRSLIDLISPPRTGKKCTLPGKVECRVEYGKILFTANAGSRCKEFCYPLPADGNLKISEAGIMLKTKTLTGSEARKINESDTLKLFELCDTSALSVRNRRAGDIFRPSGSGGSLKLKKFFINTKVPETRRDRIPLLVLGDDILWIPRFRRSSEFRITEKTLKALLVTISE